MANNPPDPEFDVPDEPLRRHQFVRWLPILLLLITMLAFCQASRDFLGTIWNVTFGILGFGGIELSDNFRDSRLLVFASTFGSFGLTFYLWLWVLSYQALVPVGQPVGVYRLTFLMLLYIFRLHGPTIFIRNGQIQASGWDYRRTGPGIVVVDQNSAVVLEETIPPPGLLTNLQRLTMAILVLLRLQNRFQSPRVIGPGVVFTRPRERIRGAVDLRPQFRNAESLPIHPVTRTPIERTPSDEDSARRVNGYTRDGIEITTTISVFFTIGRIPERLQLAYIGEEAPENLRVLTLEDLPHNRVRIRQITDDFEADPEERAAIHRQAPAALRLARGASYTPLPPVPLWPQYFPAQVFSAVFAQARRPDENIIPWHDLPRRVAIDYFREELSHINYDDLFMIGTDTPLPLNDFRTRVRMRTRNSGMLSYRMVGNSTGTPFAVGAEYDYSQLIVTPLFPVTVSRVLRDRGISIIRSGMGDLIPAEDVYRLRLDAWRSTWQRDTQLARANADLDVLREHGIARAAAQRDIVHTLTNVLRQQHVSQETLSIRIFQALENLASEPKTQALLPNETINLLHSAHDLILPEDHQDLTQQNLGGRR